jgi:hypothetical protein
VCVSFAPSLDRYLRLPALTVGAINRPASVVERVGGKRAECRPYGQRPRRTGAVARPDAVAVARASTQVLEAGDVTTDAVAREARRGPRRGVATQRTYNCGTGPAAGLVPLTVGRGHRQRGRRALRRVLDDLAGRLECDARLLSD